MYNTKYCEVHYEEAYNVVFVKWKEFCCFDDYRKPLEYALDIIKIHSSCNYVADCQIIPYNSIWCSLVYRRLT